MRGYFAKSTKTDAANRISNSIETRIAVIDWGSDKRRGRNRVQEIKDDYKDKWQDR